ncbi:MAG TPA: hypothetical protein VKE96_07890 [Vicinamibacterales bacterium]|nr:hypothetical protein [Vicinamibacterales bacterium]
MTVQFGGSQLASAKSTATGANQLAAAIRVSDDLPPISVSTPFAPPGSCADDQHHRYDRDRRSRGQSHADAVPASWTALICELQRDYARTDTVAAFMKILFDPRVPSVAAERRQEAAGAR